MLKKLMAAALSAGIALTLSGQALATTYEYHFTANPDGESGSGNPGMDVQYTFGFNGDRLPSYNMSVLNNASYWISGAIWLNASYQGQTVQFGPGLDPSAPDLRFKGDGGVIETWDIDNFLDVDLHPGSEFVLANNLPFDPFVGGQLDVYNDQADFRAAFAVWSQHDLSSLAAHAVVPEPGSLVLTGLGLLAVGWARRRCLPSH